jgi:hypothetical protein
MRFFMVVTVISASGLFASPAMAEDCVGPCIDYSGSFDITGWFIHSSDSGVSNHYIVDPTGEIDVSVRSGVGLSVVADIVAEPVLDPEPGENRIFTDVGGYVKVLQLQYDVGDFSIWGGKIHPTFGRAWDIAPGLHGTDIGGNYELVERAGAGASYGFDAGGFANVLQASLFTMDRTFLSDSYWTSRGRETLEDGGAGNTKGLSSVAVSLGGCMGADLEKCYDEGTLGYQLAALYQKGGANSSGDEVGFEGDINKSIAISEETKLKLFGEAAWFNKFGGSPDDALFVTGSGAVVLGPMTVSLTGGAQMTLAASGADTTAYLADTEALYDLGDSFSLSGETWSIGAGYTFQRDDGVDTHYFGLKLATEFSGSIPLSAAK